MKEENAHRLRQMAARLAKHRAEIADRDAASERAAFVARFIAAYEQVLRPLFEEIGAELGRAGHGHRVRCQLDPAAVRADLELLVAGRERERDAVVFLLADAAGGQEIIAELEVAGTPIEIGRFQDPAAITRPVAEQMLVDAVEHLFACAGC